MRVGTLAVLALLAAAPASGAPGDPNPQIARIVGEISPARMEATIRRLAAFGTRSSLSDTVSETRGIGAARRWIKSELERCAKDSGGRLQVAFDDHLVESGARVPKPTHFVNVVATLAGDQAESRERIYVVSGHYASMRSSPIDGEKDAPGANDDASGTAVSMELACVMSKYRFDATLVFMAVAGEEQGLLGSTGWAKDAKAKGLDIAGMFTNDIVGSTRGADGRVERARVRLFAEGVPARKELGDEMLAALRTGGGKHLPTRPLARYPEGAGARHLARLQGGVISRRRRQPP